ncbi:glycosyltransferase [Pedobacter jejuensis]|uniref:Glycosyltransferase family 1 protein n=1 Tax=Pedobacter jejuensis TaxID=1268550 RepID=A0A3N0BW77_9SPHI|nr:glycosyltransferase [Pedobacter jejuensis]RNL53954.1 glycosyltransferase family 1 protein [Pedobacter jejuensis]
MDKRIRILFGLEAAGSGTLKHLLYLVTDLNKELFDITVILSTQRSRDANNAVIKMKQAGVEVIDIPMRREINPWYDGIALYHICKHLRNNLPYHVVHAHSSKAGVLFRIAAWIWTVPLILYTPHCFYFQGKSGIKKSFFVFIEKIMGRITSQIIVSNIEKINALMNEIVPSKKLLHINNAIKYHEYNTVDKAPAKARLGIAENSTVVVSIGRLTAQKDWLTYIFAANEILKTDTEIQFLIVGEGELSTELQQLVAQLNLQHKIIFVGQHHCIEQIYSITDIYISTSLWEGLPYVILEALRFEKPIIATNLGYEFLFENANAFLVPVKDHRLIAKKIKLLRSDPCLSLKMGAHGHSFLSSHASFNIFIEKHTAIYSGVTASRKKQY